MQKTIFLISGPAGCGKNTASNKILEFGGIQYQFADPLKEVVAKVYGLDRAKLDELEYKQTPHPNLYGKTPREALQKMGTEGFRDLIHTDTWIDYMIRRIEASKNMIISVPDCRFPNEYVKVKNTFGDAVVGISIIRNTESKLDKKQQAHPSEAYFEDLAQLADHVIPNTSTLNDFNKLVGRVVQTELMKRRD